VSRLRLWFALVALGSLAGVYLLVSRALAVAETERRLRHDAVAERVLDEMERSLSELIASEDGREPVARAFIVDRYTVEGSGRLVTTPSAREEEVQRLLGARVGTVTGPFNDARQDAGTTEPLREKDQAKPEKKAEAYEILAKLNRAGEERKQKYALQTRRDAPSAARSTDALAEAPAPAAAPPPPASFAEQPSDSVLSPLRARAVDATHLALERVVATQGQMRRQGLVVDVPGLFSWLRGETLRELGDLAHVDFVGPLAAQLPETSAEFVYRRRFAEPFDSLGAQLVLQPLPGVGTAAAIEALGAALAAVLLLGLLVAYRTVATFVSFAERRAAFAASVSHELKTPLTAIRMYAEMLRDGMVPSDEKRGEYYRALAVESDRLSRLVNNVLEFSQLERGARKLSLAVAPVEPALRDALELLRVHVEREGFRLTTEIAPDTSPVRFERDALAQIAFNLVDNAVKYARDAERREIVVSLLPTPEGVALGVRDFGPGVPRDQLGLVFDPFWRGDSELTQRAKGTGIGLALVRRLAEAMGGSARARNVEPTGFEVQVLLQSHRQ
jgi:signal transduction histidine kinase